MAKTKIAGPFATGTDVAAVHNISTARRQWLDGEIEKASRDGIVYFVVPAGRRVAAIGTTEKKARSSKIVKLRKKKR